MQIIIHHSASGPNVSLEQIDQLHKARGFNLSELGYYVGYHFVIFPSGGLVQTRKKDEIGCHCVPNQGKIGICLVGDFTRMEATKSQLDALTTLLGQLCVSQGISKSDIYGHCEKSLTACPGNVIKWVRLYRQLGKLQDEIRRIQGIITLRKEKYKG